MRHLKKFASLILALVMALALAVPALAASGTSATERGTITIDNAIPEHSYTIYQIFELVSYSDVTTGTNDNGTTYPTGNFSYKVTAEWKEYISGLTKTDGTKYFELDANDMLVKSNLTDGEAAQFAKDALAWAETHPELTSTTKKAGQADEGKETTTVVFDNISLGYYLVDSTAGALCSLNTTAPNATIKEKNEQPTVEKEVKEDSTDTWGDSNDADIGQTVEFQTTITAYAGAENYILHDKMDSALRFNGVTKIVKNPGETVLSNPADYTVVTENLDDDCTFHVVFTQSFLDTLADEDEIVVSYTATLTADAKVGEGLINDTRLEYGNKHFTEWDRTKTYTWKIQLYKYTGDLAKEEDIPLAGAEFQLKNSKGEVVKFDKINDNTYKYNANGEYESVVTPADGNISFEGLDEGTYTLTELNAPDGYNKMVGDITVVISHNEDTTETTELTYKVESTQNGVVSEGTVNVLNQSGPRLPSTGGIGTTIFYVVGGLLAAGAVILLITKRRMNVGE